MKFITSSHLKQASNFISHLHFVGKFKFSNPKRGDFGVMFDEEKIKAKMEELKRKANESTQQKKSGPLVSDLMPNYKIPQFRVSTNTSGLLNFEDYSLEEKPTVLQISGYNDQSISVDNMDYPPSIIISPKQVLVWEVEGVEKLKIDDFIILKYLYPKPPYVLLAVKSISLIPRNVRQFLETTCSNIDFLEIFEGFSQYNVSTTDDVQTLAFFTLK